MNASTSFPQNSSQPVTNSTLWAPPWVPEPRGRGTWSILYRCIFTLSLCVWTVIHLNIPPRGEPASKRFWRKTKWTFIAIFAPELVLFTAWHQHLLAKKFCNEFYKIRLQQEGYEPLQRASNWKCVKTWLNKLRHRQRRSSEPGNEVHELQGKSTNLPAATEGPASALPPEFSLTYEFYVIMGGLTVDVGELYDTLSWATLTLGGVLYLAQWTSWRDFYQEDESIRDKGKANYFAKTLVIL